MFSRAKNRSNKLNLDDNSTPGFMKVQNLSAGYNGSLALDSLSFFIQHGAQIAVVGPNGAGKSTLFKVLVGILSPRSGEILIHDRPLGDHLFCVAYVPQREEVDWRFPVTVRDVVMMGRYGHQGWFGRPGPKDRKSVQESMEVMDITNLADRINWRSFRRPAAKSFPGQGACAGSAYFVDGRTFHRRRCSNPRNDTESDRPAETQECNYSRFNP